MTTKSNDLNGLSTAIIYENPDWLFGWTTMECIMFQQVNYTSKYNKVHRD